MRINMKKRNFIRLFERKKSRIDSRIKRDYIENGIATVHCCISDYNDIINTYSSKDQESLNPDFVDFLQDAAGPIPDECPLVLNVIGDCLSADEKKIIKEIIRDDFSYRLGLVEKEQDHEFKMFIFMLVGLIISGLLLWLTVPLDEVPREIFIVFFWFFGDRMFEYLFITYANFGRNNVLPGGWQVSKLFFRTLIKKCITRKSKSVSCTPNLTWNSERVGVKNEKNIYD